MPRRLFRRAYFNIAEATSCRAGNQALRAAAELSDWYGSA